MIREMKTNGLKTVSQIPEQDPGFLSVIHRPVFYINWSYVQNIQNIQNTSFKFFKISSYFKIPDSSQVADSISILVDFYGLACPVTSLLQLKDAISQQRSKNLRKSVFEIRSCFEPWSQSKMCSGVNKVDKFVQLSNGRVAWRHLCWGVQPSCRSSPSKRKHSVELAIDSARTTHIREWELKNCEN